MSKGARLPNSAPAYLLNKDGPAHDLTADRRHTKCGLSAFPVIEVTVAQVHVWLNHAMCVRCFGEEGTRWP